MTGTASMVAFSILSLAALSFCQEPTIPPPAKLDALRQRAEQGDAQAQVELGTDYEYGFSGVPRDLAEALRWYRRAAGQGNSSARFGLARMYFEGIGVERDYEAAARWYRCPTPSKEILRACKKTSYAELPNGAIALLRTMNCHVKPGDNYDSGSAVDLNGDGTPEYQVCCNPAPHGPCNSVLIGRIGSEWKDLSPSFRNIEGYEPACGLFVVLASQTGGFHDICLPNLCSSFTTTACVPTILQFNDGGYRSIDTSLKPPR